MARPTYRKYSGLLYRIEGLLPEVSWEKRAYALLLLQGDRDLFLELKEEMPEETYQQLLQLLESLPREEITSNLYQERALWALDLADRVTLDFKRRGYSFHWLDRILTSPYTGLPLALLILYIGLYQMVGQVGAGYLVDLLEAKLFQDILNPFLIQFFQEFLPWPLLRDLFVGPYGLLTLGLRYAFGLILPIVGCFFFFFSLLEDTGYLPRVGLLLDRLFKAFGLGGQAVIPIILGFGCATMATLTTRILKSERERIISTFLLSFAVPCSAQLGLIIALLSQEPFYLLLWVGVVFMAFLITGSLLSHLLPGSTPSFLIEVPALRWPHLSNIIKKTFNRMRWYFLEILPLFLYGCLLIFLLRLVGLFQVLLRPLELLMNFMGLPQEVAFVFFFGFFRRDYGAAGLYDLYQGGILEGPSLLVAAVTLTLFLPCLPQLLVNIKERGPFIAFLIISAILPLAFLTGFLLQKILSF